VWFSVGENDEKVYRSPGFPAARHQRGKRCAAFFAESRMQSSGPTKLHRKSGFGLHQLPNSLMALPDYKSPCLKGPGIRRWRVPDGIGSRRQILRVHKYREDCFLPDPAHRSMRRLPQKLIAG
jgi:hypothetical protein